VSVILEWKPGCGCNTPERLATAVADVKRAGGVAGRAPANLGVAPLVQGFFE